MTEAPPSGGSRSPVQEPDVPEGLRAWIRDRVGGEGPTRERALAALERARALPGAAREGAWWLLAADALLTTAAGEALDADDPEEVLRRLILDAADARG